MKIVVKILLIAILLLLFGFIKIIMKENGMW